MIKDFKENLFTDVMNKFGFNDMFNKVTPVVIKQDFIADEHSFIMAGTVGCIEKVKSYDVKYKKEFAVCHLTFTTPKRGYVRLLCKIPDGTDSVKVFGLKDTIEFKELFEAADEETSRMVEEYHALIEDYGNEGWRYDNNTETASYVSFVVAAILFIVGLIGFAAFKNIALGIGFALPAIIIALVGAVLYFRSFHNTKKGKTLDAQIEALADDITKKDEKFYKDKRMFKVYNEEGNK